MLLVQISDDLYLIQLDKKVSWDEFREKARVVSGTHAETITRRIYSSAIEYSTDLFREFEKYYKNEYESFSKFLFWRYGVSQEIIEQINNDPKGYLAIFEYSWQINNDDILKKSFERLFTEVEGKP